MSRLVFLFVICLTTWSVADPLHEAAAQGNVSSIGELIRKGSKIDARDKQGNTAFSVAFKKYLDLGTNLNCQAAHLFLASMRELLRLGADPDILEKSGTSPLRYALQNHRVDIFRSLLNIDNPEFSAEFASDLLLQAINKDFVNVVHIFLEAGLCPNIAAKNAYYPLVHAVRLKRLDIVKMLLAAGANPDIASDGDSNTLLHYAARFKSSEEIVQALLDAGANIESMESFGYTPLHYAITYDSPAIAKVLLRNNANYNAVSHNHMTMLEAAVVVASVEMVKVLLKTGADPYVCDKAGRTPLQQAEAYQKNSGNPGPLKEIAKILRAWRPN